MADLGKCQKCKGEIQLPSIDGIEAAADALNREAQGHRGTALAYLWMVAGCMRGLCLLCQQWSVPRIPEQEARS